MECQKDMKIQNILKDTKHKNVMYITLLSEKNITFSNQTKKGCDLIPLLQISSEAAQPNTKLPFLLLSPKPAQLTLFICVLAWQNETQGGRDRFSDFYFIIIYKKNPLK